MRVAVRFCVMHNPKRYRHIPLLVILAGAAILVGAVSYIAEVPLAMNVVEPVVAGALVAAIGTRQVLN